MAGSVSSGMFSFRKSSKLWRLRFTLPSAICSSASVKSTPKMLSAASRRRRSIRWGLAAGAWARAGAAAPAANAEVRAEKNRRRFIRVPHFTQTVKGEQVPFCDVHWWLLMPATLPPHDIELLARGLHPDPFAVLGPHDVEGGVLIRVFRPHVRGVEVILLGQPGGLV